MKKKLSVGKMIPLLAVILLLIVGMSVYAFYHAIHAVDLGVTSGAPKYDYHFVMIHSGTSDDFWTSLYNGAQREGENIGAYVEDFGELVPGEYSTEDLMEMAIAAQVDGIVVEGNQSEEMKSLINQAESKDITVVTMMQDVAESDRKTYVGINAYSLGVLYGNQVVEVLQKNQEAGREEENSQQKVVVLVDSSGQEADSGLVFFGIRETIAKTRTNVQVTSLNIEKNKDFESEEIIRNLVLNQQSRPDVVVNLSSVDTISCSQAVIDYNLVGKVNVLGYYSAPEVIDGIEKGVIWASVDIDAEKMGETCVANLHKFILKGYVNEYASVDMKLITKENIAEYQKKNRAREE